MGYEYGPDVTNRFKFPLFLYASSVFALFIVFFKVFSVFLVNRELRIASVICNAPDNLHVVTNMSVFCSTQKLAAYSRKLW